MNKLTFNELKEKFLDGIKVEDFTGDLQLVAQECGKEAALLLSDNLPKVELSICTARSLDVESLSGGLNLVKQLCGVETVYLLTNKMGGMTIYIRPATKIDSLRYPFLLKYFNGTNRGEMGLIIGCSSRHVYRLYKEAMSALTKKVLTQEVKQAALF